MESKEEFLICWIRTTYPARKRLNNWYKTLDNIIEELDKRKLLYDINKLKKLKT